METRFYIFEIKFFGLKWVNLILRSSKSAIFFEALVKGSKETISPGMDYTISSLSSFTFAPQQSIAHRTHSAGRKAVSYVMQISRHSWMLHDQCIKLMTYLVTNLSNHPSYMKKCKIWYGESMTKYNCPLD